MTDPETPAEARLHEHLEVVRAQPPQPGRDLVRRILRSAHWQAAARTPLKLVGMLAASVLDVLGAVFGSGRRRAR